MVVVDQFLHLYESDQISSVWKVVQILLYVICGLSSVIAAYSFGRLNFHYLNDNCLLYSNVTFHKEHISKSYVHFNDLSENLNVSRVQDLGLHIGPVNNMITEWGNPRACSYCIYVPTCSFIFCFVWATFFTMCGRGGRSLRGLPSPWRIVYPALFFNLLYFVTSFVASAWLHSGLQAFCLNFRKNMDETSCGALYRYANPPSHAVYTYITIARVFSWITTFIWLLHIICLILRCVFVADFNLYRIQIITAQPISPNKVKVKFEDLDGSPSPAPKRTRAALRRKERSSAINVIDNPASNFALKSKVSSMFRLHRADSSYKKRQPVTFEQPKAPLILVEDLSESSPDTSEMNSVEDNVPTVLTELNEDVELPRDDQKPTASAREAVEPHAVDVSDEAVGGEIKKLNITQLLNSASKKRIPSPPASEISAVKDDGSREEEDDMVELFNADKSLHRSLIASVNALETLESSGEEVAGTSTGIEPSRSPGGKKGSEPSAVDSRGTEPSRSPEGKKGSEPSAVDSRGTDSSRSPGRKTPASRKGSSTPTAVEGAGTSKLVDDNNPVVAERSIGTSMSDLIQANRELNAKKKESMKGPTKKDEENK